MAATVPMSLAACTRQSQSSNGTVVLYSSVDDEYLRLVVEKFEKSTGIRVLVKGDTEATKTTGLAERLRAEHAAGKPGADVWWSSEPFLTITLAHQGVFAPMTDEMFDDLPREQRGSGNLWGMFAYRARVLVRRKPNRNHVYQLPSILGREFTGSGPAIAHPAFGTTRGHFGWILAQIGRERFVSWLKELRAGGVKIVDGNSAVVRMVASGEAEFGLTDSDDVWSGQAQGWKIFVEPATLHVQDHSEARHGAMRLAGPLVIPNSAALVRGGANPTQAAALVRFIMSRTTEGELMTSNSRNIPVRPHLREVMKQEPFQRYHLGLLGGRFQWVPLPMAIDDAANMAQLVQELSDAARAAPLAIRLARAEGLA